MGVAAGGIGAGLVRANGKPVGAAGAKPAVEPPSGGGVRPAGSKASSGAIEVAEGGASSGVPVQAGEAAGGRAAVVARPGDAADTSALLDVLADRPGDIRPFKARTTAAIEGGEIGVAPRSVAELKRTQQQIAEGLAKARAEARFLPEGAAENVAKLEARIKTSDAEIAASAFEHLEKTGGRFITGDFLQAQALHRLLGFPKERILSVRDWDPRTLLLLLSLGGLGASAGSQRQPMTPDHQ